MQYTPKKNKIGKRVSFICMLISCIGLIFTCLLDIRYRVFYQAIALLVYVFSFEILHRYYMTTFTYALDEGNFIITKRVGKRVQTVCNLALSTCVAIEKQPKGKDARKVLTEKYGKINMRYNYCQSMHPSAPESILFEFNGGLCEIVFEPNAEMSSRVKAEICRKNEAE